MVSPLRAAAGKPKQDREKFVSFPFSIRWCDPFMSFPLQIMPSPIEFLPVSSSFPCPQISVQFSVRDASIFSGTEIWRQVKQRIRYVCWAYISPMPIVAGGSVPTPFMGGDTSTRDRKRCPLLYLGKSRHMFPVSQPLGEVQARTRRGEIL